MNISDGLGQRLTSSQEYVSSFLNLLVDDPRSLYAFVYAGDVSLDALYLLTEHCRQSAALAFESGSSAQP